MWTDSPMNQERTIISAGIVQNCNYLKVFETQQQINTHQPESTNEIFLSKPGELKTKGIDIICLRLLHHAASPWISLNSYNESQLCTSLYIYNHIERDTNMKEYNGIQDLTYNITQLSKVSSKDCKHKPSGILLTLHDTPHRWNSSRNAAKM